MGDMLPVSLLLPVLKLNQGSFVWKEHLQIYMLHSAAFSEQR